LAPGLVPVPAGPVTHRLLHQPEREPSDGITAPSEADVADILVEQWSRVMENIPLSAINPRRWLVLTVVVAAQFMYVVDIFIVNVAIPSIRADLNASTAQIESVIALSIAYELR
jgi:hypothetical protein